MAVVKDALGTDTAFAPATAGPQTTTYSGLTVVSNTNGAIVLTVVIADPAASPTVAISTVTGYTFIGALSELGTDAGVPPDWIRVELWGKVGNSTGAQSISITTNAAWTASSTAVFCAISVTGASQVGGTTTFANFTSNKGTAATATSGNVTTATTDLAVAVTGLQNNYTAAGQNQTSIYLDNVPNPSSAAQYAQGAASPVTLTWATGDVGSQTWVVAAADIVPPAAAAGGTLPLMGVG